MLLQAQDGKLEVLRSVYGAAEPGEGRRELEVFEVWVSLDFCLQRWQKDVACPDEQESGGP